MQLKRGIIWACVIVVIVVGAFYLNYTFKKNANAPVGVSASAVSMSPLQAGDAAKQITPPQSVFVSPQKITTIVMYDLVAQNGAFSPSELVVAKGGRVQIAFKAIDADYDLQMAAPLGLYLVAKKGTSMPFGFDASKVGRYEFACQKLCPSSGPMKGVLIVK